VVAGALKEHAEMKLLGRFRHDHAHRLRGT